MKLMVTRVKSALIHDVCDRLRAIQRPEPRFHPIQLKPKSTRRISTSPLVFLLLNSPFIGMMVMHAVARSMEHTTIDPIAACYDTQFAALESIQNSIHTVRAEVFGSDAEIEVLRLTFDAQNVERKLADCAQLSL